MFVLAVFHDTIPIEPVNFNKQHEEHLKELIQDLYVDRVITDVGLVIAFYDFISIDEARIYNGDGRAHFKTAFRLLVFQPHVGEVLQGVITNNDALGLQISLEFFSDIRIPSLLLREPKGYDADEKTWYWDFEGHKLTYPSNSVVRFRVAEIRYTKPEHTPNKSEEETGSSNSLKPAAPPMAILGSVAEDGLGLRSWWES